MKGNVKGMTESLKESLTAIKKQLDYYGISLRQVGLQAGVSPNVAPEVFSFRSANIDVINAAMELIDQRIDLDKKIAERVNRQQESATREYFLQNSRDFNLDNQMLQATL